MIPLDAEQHSEPSQYSGCSDDSFGRYFLTAPPLGNKVAHYVARKDFSVREDYGWTYSMTTIYRFTHNTLKK